MSTDTATRICPGCGRETRWTPDCEHCEYHNLVTGRSHYCGQDWCYCRELRRTIKREVLNAFAARNAEVLARVGVDGWNNMGSAERKQAMAGVWPPATGV